MYFIFCTDLRKSKAATQYGSKMGSFEAWPQKTVHQLFSVDTVGKTQVANLSRRVLTRDFLSQEMEAMWASFKSKESICNKDVQWACRIMQNEKPMEKTLKFIVRIGKHRSSSYIHNGIPRQLVLMKFNSICISELWCIFQPFFKKKKKRKRK